MSVDLPKDLLRPIIQQIEDPATLCALSLCCTEFRDEAQRFLFREPTSACTPMDIHHRFLDAIIASPNRLALWVRSYTQHLPLVCPHMHAETPLIVFDIFATLQEKSSFALGIMTNLKRLDYASIYNPAPAATILRGCTFQLEALHWGCPFDEEELFQHLLPTQPALKHLSLPIPYEPQAQLSPPPPSVCPKLESLHVGPNAAVALLQGRHVKRLRVDSEIEFMSRMPEVARELSRVKYYVHPDATSAVVIAGSCRNLTHFEVKLQAIAWAVRREPMADVMRALIALRLLPHIAVLVLSHDAGSGSLFLDEYQRWRAARLAFQVSRSLLQVDISTPDLSYTRFLPAPNRDIASHVDGLSARAVQSWHMAA